MCLGGLKHVFKTGSGEWTRLMSEMQAKALSASKHIHVFIPIHKYFLDRESTEVNTHSFQMVLFTFLFSQAHLSILCFMNVYFLCKLFRRKDYKPICNLLRVVGSVCCVARRSRCHIIIHNHVVHVEWGKCLR